MKNTKNIKLIIILLIGLTLFIFLRFRPKPEIPFRLGFYEPFLILGLSFFLGKLLEKFQKFLILKKSKETPRRPGKFAKYLNKYLEIYSSIIFFLHKIDYVWFETFPILYFRWCHLCNVSFMREFNLTHSSKKFDNFLGFILVNREFIPFSASFLADLHFKTWHYIYWGIMVYFLIRMLKNFRFHWSETFFFFCEKFKD